MSLGLVFMGTPRFALPTLQAVIEAGHRVLAVYTKPPREAGRGLEQRLSPIHRFALHAGLPVEAPLSLKPDDIRARFAGYAADAAVVVAYGLVLPEALLNAPSHGSFNVHASLLPRWRGAAPISRAIMAGDRQTGVTIMRMTEGLDEGPICLSKTVPIDERETAGELHDRLASEGAGLMVEALLRLEQGALAQVPQPEEGATYASKITKAEARIDFARPAPEVLRHIHGLSPAPGAWCTAAVGQKRQRLKILKAETVPGVGPPAHIIDEEFTIACAAGAVRPLIVQREGKAAMPREEFLRGLPIKPGDRLD